MTQSSALFQLKKIFLLLELFVSQRDEWKTPELTGFRDTQKTENKKVASKKMEGCHKDE